MKYLFILLAIFIVPFTLKADVVKKMLFSNKGYAKQIEVKTYVLTQEQVVDLFKNQDKMPELLTVKELNKINKLYLVARIKNLGEMHAWGILNCKIPNVGIPIKMSFINITKYDCDCMICLGSPALYQENNDLPPDISYEWSELYTK